MDGTQKLPQRILASLQWQLQRGGAISRLSLVLAAWIAYARGAALRGDLDDPLAGELGQLYQQAGDRPEEYLAAVLAWPTLIPPALGTDQRLYDTLLLQLRALQGGVESALATIEN